MKRNHTRTDPTAKNAKTTVNVRVSIASITVTQTITLVFKFVPDFIMLQCFIGGREISRTDSKNVHAVSVGRIVSAAEVGRHCHVVHYDSRDDAAPRKQKEARPAEQPIALALNVEAGVLEQHMRIKPALENTEGHNGRRSENDVVQRLIRIIKYFLPAEAVVQAEQPHAKRKRETLIKEVQDQHGDTPVVPLAMHENQPLQIPAPPHVTYF